MTTPTTTAITVPEEQPTQAVTLTGDEQVKALSTVAKMAMLVKVTDKESYEDGLSRFAKVKEAIKSIKGIFFKSVDSAKKSKEAATLAYKEAVALQDEALLSFENAEAHVNQEITRYLTEENRKKKQAILDAAEAKRVEDARLAKIAEDERTRLADAAKEAAGKGMNTLADTLNEMKEEVVTEKTAPIVTEKKAAPIVTGGMSTHQREDITVTVTDMFEICRLIVKGVLTTDVIDIRAAELKKQVKALGVTTLAGMTIEDKVAPIMKASTAAAKKAAKPAPATAAAIKPETLGPLIPAPAKSAAILDFGAPL